MEREQIDPVAVGPADDDGPDAGGDRQGGDGHGGDGHGGDRQGGELRLRPPRHPVDPRAVRWWTAQALVTVVPLVVALVAAALLIDALRGWLVAALVVAAVGGAAYVVVMPRWRYRVHRWETTPEAVYAASGWLLQEWRVAPLSRVQTVDTQRGPLQQLFGLASVTVTTASAKGAIVIEGLDHGDAVELVGRLTETTQAIPGDAT